MVEFKKNLVLGVWSNKGGQCKTTLSTAIACAMGKILGDETVLLIDTDSQSNVTDLLTIMSRRKCDLYKLLCNPQHGGIPNKTAFNFDLVVGSSDTKVLAHRFGEDLPDVVTRLFERLKYDYPVIIVDCSPSLEGELLKNVLLNCDVYLIPVNMESSVNLTGVINSVVYLTKELGRPSGKGQYKVIKNRVGVNRYSEKRLNDELDVILEEYHCPMFAEYLPFCPAHIDQTDIQKMPAGYNRDGYYEDILVYQEYLNRFVKSMMKHWRITLPELQKLGGRSNGRIRR